MTEPPPGELTVHRGNSTRDGSCNCCHSRAESTVLIITMRNVITRLCITCAKRLRVLAVT